MTKITWAILAIFIASNLTAQPVKLSLNDAIDYAVKNQPAFQNYKVDQQITSAKKLEAISKFVPKVNGSFDLKDNLRLPTIALKFPNPITGAEQNLKIQQGTKYQGIGSVDATIPLIDATAIADYNYNKKQQMYSDYQVQQAMIDLKINVSRAYYLALLNNERVKKNEKAVERFQKAYDDTKVRYDNQNALKTDMNRAYLNLQNAKFQLKVSQDSIKTANLSLAQTIGLPLSSSIELADALPTDVNAEAVPEYPDYKSAELSRVELKNEGAQELMNREQLKKINFGYIPTLSGYASIGGTGLDNDKLFQKSSWFWSSYIGLKLTVPIFDGLQKVSQMQQQKLMITKNHNNINNIKQTINYQLQNSMLSYINAAENVKLTKDNMALAEEVVKDVNVRYQNSLVTYQEVLDAESTLKDSEFNYLQALYAFLIADLDWKKANGKL